MVWWQRLLFGVLVGLVNFGGLFLWLIVTIPYSQTPTTYAIFISGGVTGTYFFVLTVQRLVPSCETCSVVASTTGVLLSAATFQVMTTQLSGWFGAHGWNDLRGPIALIPIPIGMIALTTFWRQSRAIRIGETAVAILAWSALLTLLLVRGWEFADGANLDAAADARWVGWWCLASTSPFMIALLITFWRDDRGDAAGAHSSVRM